ncbi:DUF6308 family protein [Geodermatophilus sp. CPCC 205761]|uniref:DUF6308 family protein n=1 Tax=Geodermatophilus sp. CPCC 205761 TaxID=2936597 RepID=UPI003EE8DC83
MIRYTCPTAHYAFRTYDQSDVRGGPVTPADVLMVNLLSLRFDWRDVTPLFVVGETPHVQLRQALDEALTEARALPALEDCTEEQAAMPALREANSLALAVPRSPRRDRRTWGPVAVSKVLHRLAPTVPLIDSYVCAFFATRSPRDIRLRMRAELIANQRWLTELAERHPVRGEPMPLTRVADIAIWMDAQPS